MKLEIRAPGGLLAVLALRLAKPSITSERHLAVQCLLAKGDGTPCLKKTQL